MSTAGGQSPRAHQDAPRRVRNGYRLRTAGPEGVDLPEEAWVAGRWLALMNAHFSEEALRLGLEYARSGQTTALEIGPTGIEAQVQGRAAKPHRTILHPPHISQSQWSEVVATMAGEAAYAAGLLAGTLPSGMKDLFKRHGLELLPVGAEALRTECSCGHRRPGGCKHAAAVSYLIAERLIDDPLLVLQLHGMSAPSLLDHLRQARAIRAGGAAAAHPDPLIPETQIEPPPLEACLDGFWRCGRQLTELEKAPPPQHLSHALLRRLGPSPMKGRFPLAGLLASIYDAVSEHARQMLGEGDVAEGANDDRDE